MLSPHESYTSELGSSSLNALQRVDTWASALSSESRAARVLRYRPARLPLYLLYKRLNVRFGAEDGTGDGDGEAARRHRRPLSATASSALPRRVLVPLRVHHRYDWPHPSPRSVSESGRSEPRAEEHEGDEESAIPTPEPHR